MDQIITHQKKLTEVDCINCGNMQVILDKIFYLDFSMNGNLLKRMQRSLSM